MGMFSRWRGYILTIDQSVAGSMGKFSRWRGYILRGAECILAVIGTGGHSQQAWVYSHHTSDNDQSDNDAVTMCVGVAGVSPRGVYAAYARHGHQPRGPH
eukprot:7654567-Pyramimonas_sp.AAC.1